MPSTLAQSPERLGYDPVQRNAFVHRPKRDGIHFESPVHTPGFGATVVHLMGRAFHCQFDQSETDVNAEIPLSVYIENVVFATGYPFTVLIATLTLLERLSARLPRHLYEARLRFSPHRLFTAAYILAAKQHTQVQLGLDYVFSPDEQSLNPISNAYWARHTSYSPNDVDEMQKELLVVLGGNIVVFPPQKPEAEETVREMKSEPVSSVLPAAELTTTTSSTSPSKVGTYLLCLLENTCMPNFARLSAEEQVEIFENASRRLKGMAAQGIEVDRQFLKEDTNYTLHYESSSYGSTSYLNLRNKGKTTAWWVHDRR
ncbi:hypothetical protein NLJ89_g2904 [Agrocybe chaxingu]|uniref:Uncharacterized protein n=1 Tax=Agrocybe chaxingu TaxID=84603 RepID=A0A9W8MW08_9AGAR|nr:hypothetical protein NLJ89_g2904 [Agrocybe chaxingu]